MNSFRLSFLPPLDPHQVLQEGRSTEDLVKGHSQTDLVKDRPSLIPLNHQLKDPFQQIVEDLSQDLKTITILASSQMFWPTGKTN